MPQVRVMKNVWTLALACALLGYGQTATIRMQEALASVKEGQLASERMQSKFGPRVAALEKQEAELKVDLERLGRESKEIHGWWLWRHRMKPEVRATRQRELDARAKALGREREDGRASVEQERRRVLYNIMMRMNPLLAAYAREHGYTVILDASEPRNGVLITSTDITGEIVRMYDLAYPIP